MKKVLSTVAIVIGGIVASVALLQLGGFLFDYRQLSTYGKGFIWGNCFLFIAGTVLIVAGFRNYKKK